MGQTDSDKASKPATPEVFTYVEEMPKFIGGQDAMMKYIAATVKYPDSARDKGIQGKVFVNFVVNEDGKISNVKILRGIGGGCDEEAKRVVEGMPVWEPGKQNGKNVAVYFNLPIQFRIVEDTLQKREIKSSSKPIHDSIYSKVTDRAKFSGGDDARKDYLNYNIKYPKIAIASNVQGKVTVRFIVNADGKLSDVTVMKGIGSGCDQEAKRVIEAMPDWIPAQRKGINVSSYYELTINFVLPNADERIRRRSNADPNNVNHFYH